MIDKLNSLFNIFDVGDVKFFLLVAKKNIKNLTPTQGSKEYYYDKWKNSWFTQTWNDRSYKNREKSFGRESH